MIEEKDLEFFYIFGVRSDINKDLKSELSLDFLVEYTSKDIKKKELAKVMVENKMFPTSNQEAISAVDLSGLSGSIHGGKIRARCEHLTVHKFKSTFPMTREDIGNYVKSSNVCEYTRNKLIEAKIRF